MVGDFGLRTYTQLIESCVFSVCDYGAEVTGHKTPREIDNVMLHAARYYLGVNKFCPLPCLHSEMGWLSSDKRRQHCIIRYFNRLMKLEDNRIPRLLFKYRKNNEGSWAALTRELLEELHLYDYWVSETPIPMDLVDFRI